MILQKIFNEYKYYDLLRDENATRYKLAVRLFYDDTGEIPQELKHLYISKTGDELFLILDSTNHTIKELCKKWDQKISIFIAFGSDEEKVTEKLKYNVVQIILYEGNIEDRSEEGSLSVSRKILLPFTTTEEGDILIPDEEVVEIPFYIIPVGNFLVQPNILEDLKTCIPDSMADDLEFLNEPMKKNNRKKGADNKIIKIFNEDQYKKIEGWLNSYDYSDN